VFEIRQAPLLQVDSAIRHTVFFCMYPVYVTSSFGSYIAAFKVHPYLKASLCVYTIEKTNFFVFVGFRVGLSVILRGIVSVVCCKVEVSTTS